MLVRLSAGSKRYRRPVAALLMAAGLALGGPVPATGATQPSSGLDAHLFYQLLIGEIELRSGRAGNAFEVILEAARKRGDAALYQRAIEIALQSRAGDQALVAARAWRSAHPASIDALRYETQILMALNRIDELAVPLSAWLAAASVVERPGLIALLPRLLQRAGDRGKALALAQKVLAPYRQQPATRAASQVAIGRLALAAGQRDLALSLATDAAQADPAAQAPALLALEMLPAQSAAEALVTRYLERPDASLAVRLAYARALTQSQRLADAIAQLEIVTRQRPEVPDSWLTLGALHVELRQAAPADAALQRYLATATAAPQPRGAEADDDEAEAATSAGAGRDLTQAWLLLAQAAELRGDLAASEAWLARIDSPQRALEVQSRRATLLARQGQVAQARALIRSTPERTGDDARAKLVAEAHVLREVKQWRQAADVLAEASRRFEDDTELIYELAMVEDKLERHDEMERLLRRVIALKPDHSHAHNALGYSLADRNLRLVEARELIRRAIELSPGDPFITDSLGWVEFRLGNHEESIRLLRQAYSARPDTEIGAHLGEVLWVSGRHDEARRIWLEARNRDAANEVLLETLARLKVGL